MKKYLLLILVLASKNIFSQNTNVYDFAPAAQVTTNGSVTAGGATARSFNSTTVLGAGGYIILDCGTAVPPSTITFGTFWSSDGRFIPNSYTIECSNDGSNWSNVVPPITGNTSLTPSHSFSGLQMRYWKLTVTAVQPGQTICSIAGLQLLGGGVGAATNNSYWNIGGYNTTSINYMAGNVGVGTASPTTLWGRVLQVYDINNAALSVKTTVADWQLVTDASGGLHFRDISGGGNAGRLFIGSNGNVGIGTTGINDAGYKLYVETGIRTRKVKVDRDTWADYVFHANYHLRPISEVEQFIKQHQHLPEVPSAAEVGKEGLDLGDNQATLLKKIEELTLYLIEQNKKLEAQNKRMEKLEAANEQLMLEIQMIKNSIKK